MSDFLFIIPEGWTALPVGVIDHIPAGISVVQTWIDTGNVGELTTALHDAEQLSLDQYVIEAKLFNGEMLVVRLATV